MKIVIDLPEWFIEDTKEFNHPTPMDKVIINGQPLSEVLDKIRAEIEEERVYDDWDFGQEIYYNNAIEDVLKIIDKHKEERGNIDQENE